MITEKERLTFMDKFKLFTKYGVFRFKQLQENGFETITHYQKIYYDLKIKNLENQLLECNQTLENQSFDEIANKHEQASIKIFNHYLSQKFKKKKNYKMDSFKMDFNSFIEDYPVVLSTAYSVTYSTGRDFMYDYVIVDEASTLDLVKAMLPLSCAKKIVIVGDQKQLPHIPGKTELTFDDEAYDYNKQNIMSSLECLHGDTLKLTLLQEHYRCHPDIIRFCNLKYYNEELIIYNDYSNLNPISVIKTAKGNHMRELTSGARGTFNQRELEELNNFIKNESEYNIKLCSKDHNDIGFLTPYRFQVELSKEINPKEIEKDTIHKYQGREKAIIIYSTVLDQSVKAKKKMIFVNDPQMVNVAVSRAEKQLIVISNTDAFYKNGNDVGDLIRYIEYHDVKNLKKGRIISVFDLLYKEYSQVDELS